VHNCFFLFSIGQPVLVMEMYIKDVVLSEVLLFNDNGFVDSVLKMNIRTTSSSIMEEVVSK
jgi:hypothetical protein